MKKTMYTATFSRHEHLSENDHSVLRQTEEGGPLYLDEVTDMCAGFGVGATLYDTLSNLKRGSVDEHGNYTLV